MVDVKKELLNIGEDTAVQLVRRVVKPLAEQYIKDSDNKVDDIILPFLDMIEDALIDLLDEIDGEQDI